MPVVVMVPKVTTGQICKVSGREPVQPRLSVAVMVMLVPGPFEVVGVPVLAPDVAFSAKPAGSARGWKA